MDSGASQCDTPRTPDRCDGRMQDFLTSYEAWLALAILLLTFCGFLLERFPPEVTASAGAAAFVALGLVAPGDVLAVFSNPAPLTIGAMFVLTGALVRTGVLEAAAGKILEMSGSRPAIAVAALITGAVAFSAFINNTALVLVLIPITIRIAREFDIAPTRLLIPISYAAILGGTCTLIGTSTNLLVDGVARDLGMMPFSIFEITPVGLVTALSGLVMLGLFGRLLLPDRDDSDAQNPGDLEFLSELTLLENGKGQAISDIALLKLPGLRVLGLQRGGQIQRDGLEEVVLKKGDRLVIAANSSQLLTLEEAKEWRVGLPRQGQPPQEPVIVEAIAAPHKASIGRPIGELGLGSRFGARVLGVHRHMHIAGKSLDSVLLRPADRLLLEGTSAGFDAMTQQRVLVAIDRTSGRAFRRTRAPVAVLALLGVVALAAFGVMEIAPLAMIAVAAILLLRCIDSAEAWGSIDGAILVLIFAMLVIGAGLQQSGAIGLMVGALAPMLAGMPPLATLLLAYLVTSTLTEVVSNNAVAVLMTPIVMALGNDLGMDPRSLVIAVMFAASASFATPIGYQTNTLVYGAGNYRFADFVRVGIPMNLIVGLASCLAIYFWFGL